VKQNAETNSKVGAACQVGLAVDLIVGTNGSRLQQSGRTDSVVMWNFNRRPNNEHTQKEREREREREREIMQSLACFSKPSVEVNSVLLSGECRGRHYYCYYQVCSETIEHQG